MRTRPRTRPRPFSSSWPGRPDPFESPGHSAPGCTGSRSAWHAVPGPRPPGSGPPSEKKPKLRTNAIPPDQGWTSWTHAELHEEINRLPEKYRQPIILFYMQGQTQEEAAQTLGWPLGTVQVRLHRGRERLRSRLTRSSAGVLAFTGLEFKPALKPGMVERDWTVATARAAVRFAAGKGTAGLVAPSVARVGESVIAAMFGDTLKFVALVVSPLFLGALCFSVLGLPAKNRETRRSQSGPGPHAATLVEPANKGMSQKVVGKMAQATVASARPEVIVLADHRPPAVSPGATAPKSTVDVPRSSLAASRTGSLAMASTHVLNLPANGRELFERVWVVNDRRSRGGDGLGPVFNGQSCVACHHLGGTGGAGGLDSNIDIGTVFAAAGDGMSGYAYSFSMDFGAGRMEYRIGGDANASTRERPGDPNLLAAIHPGFRDARSTVLHRYGTDPAYNAWRESVSGRHGSVTVTNSQRNPPALFGAGLIDAIPDAVIEAAARRKGSASPQVRGRVSRLKDGRLGRFGWKVQTATLHEFVRSAAAGEIGLEVPGRHQAADPRLPGIAATGLDMDESDCDALVKYVRSLPAPIATKGAGHGDPAQVKAGETSFKSIGCSACHMPKLGDVEGIFSDLLLHDMGPQLGDADAYSVFVGEPARPDGAAADRVGANGPASMREWRTPPLWGVRDSGPYLHDGRAATIAEAIALHAGQGATAARRYGELSPRRKQQIEAFLFSLAPPVRN